MECSALISRDMEEKDLQNCAFCFEKALYRCSCCVTTPYCSMACQNNHWINHKKDCRNIGLLSKSVTLWKQTISPPMKVFFEVMVQYLQDFDVNMAVAWVIETRYLPIFQRLRMHKETSAKAFRQLEDIKKDMLVMILHDGMLQRARVLQVYAETQIAIIRFLDTGLSKVEPFSSLLMPTPEMERTMALAFNIMLISEHTISLSKGCKIWIQTMGIRSPSGCYHAVQMPKFFGFPFASKRKKTKIELIKLFNCNQAAICRDTIHEISILAQCDDMEILTYSPGEGSFVLAMHAKQWQRGRLIGWSDEASIPHLVYLFDLGKMCFSKALKPLPAACQETVMRAFIITFDESNIGVAVHKKSADLSIVVDEKAIKTSINHAIDKYAPALPCQLYQAEMLLGNVEAQNFTGFLESIDLDFWKETICDESVVVVTSFLNEKCVAISPAWTSKYRKLFAAMAHQCLPKIDASIDEIDDISLAYNTEDKYYFRAQYIFHIEDDEKEIIQVVDIDTGQFSMVRTFQLRELNRFLRSCPVYLTYVELSNVESVKPIIEHSKTFSALTRCCDNATEFILKYEKNNTKNATLNYRSDSKCSLNAKLNELLKSDQDGSKNSIDKTSQSLEGTIAQETHDNEDSSQIVDCINTSKPSDIEEHAYASIHSTKHSTNVKVNCQKDKSFFEHENCLNATPNSTMIKPPRKHSIKKYADLIKKVTKSKTDDSFECNTQNNQYNNGDDDEINNKTKIDKETFHMLDKLKCPEIKTNFNAEQSLSEREHDAIDNMNNNNENVINEASPQKTIAIKNGNETETIEMKRIGDKRIHSILELVQNTEAGKLSFGYDENMPAQINADDTQMNVSLGSKKLSFVARRNFLLNYQRVRPKKFVLSDLKAIGINEGDNVPLLILDVSTIQENGLLTAADNTDRKGIHETQQAVTFVGKYAEEITNSADCYEPSPNEICLAIFSEDNLWYRAMRLDDDIHANNDFVMQFIDFGNVATISKADIRPITEKFTFPIIANKCRIQGLNQAQIGLLNDAQIVNDVLHCEVQFNEIDEIYDISIVDFEILF